MVSKPSRMIISTFSAAGAFGALVDSGIGLVK